MGDKQWYGNERMQELLAGPFYGFGLQALERAVEVDYGLRRRGQFSMRYFSKYIVCSGPEIIRALGELLSPEESGTTVYVGQDIAECVAAIFHGEGLKLSSGYAEKGRADDGKTKGPGGADNAPDEASQM